MAAAALVRGRARAALKMATGTGKTVVMAMLVAWQALNRFADPRTRAHTDAFLVVTPGITIKDRLRVVLPSSPDGAENFCSLITFRKINEDA